MYAPRPPMASCETNIPRTSQQKNKCVPITLRLCLLTWAYLRMGVSILWSSVILIFIVQAFIYHKNGIILQNEAIPTAFSPLIFMPQLLEMAMILTFIVAGHKKSVKLYRIYFYYCIISLVTYIVTTTVCFFFEFELVFLYMTSYMTFFFVELLPVSYDEATFAVASILDVCLEFVLILLVKRQIRRYSCNVENEEDLGKGEKYPVNA